MSKSPFELYFSFRGDRKIRSGVCFVESHHPEVDVKSSPVITVNSPCETTHPHRVPHTTGVRGWMGHGCLNETTRLLREGWSVVSTGREVSDTHTTQGTGPVNSVTHPNSNISQLKCYSSTSADRSVATFLDGL